MSQHSLLNIQQISSRTFNNDPSIMQTSIEHFERQNHPNFTKYALSDSRHDLHNMSLKKTINRGFEEVINQLKIQNQSLKKDLQFNRVRLIDSQKGNGNINQQMIVKQLMQELNKKQIQLQQSKRNYLVSIFNLRQTLQKNQILSQEVARLTRKLQVSELNYSRQQQTFQRSQNLISNLSVTKSNYEIQMVNMKDSLIILEKQNQKIAHTNQQYENKLAMIAQEVQRLRILLEKTKKQNQMLKFNIEDAGLKIKKYQSQTIEQKTILERLRLQNRDFNSKISNLSLQLREYHQKLTYKQTIINDHKEGQGKIQKLIRDKQSYIKELQGKLVQMQRSFKMKEEQYSKQKNSYTQQIGRLRSKVNEESSSAKQIINQNQNIQRQHEQLVQKFNYLKNQYNKYYNESNALHQQLKSIQQQRDDLIRNRQALIRQLESFNNQKKQLNNQLQRLKSETQAWRQRYQNSQNALKRYEQNQKVTKSEWQAKFDMLNQQRSTELNELNKYKYQLSTKINQINQIKSEISVKSNQVSRLKEETISVSTVFDTSKKEFDEKIRQKNQMINDLKNRLSNCQKLIQQNRRQRDLIFQEKNSLMIINQKTEQTIELKNNELRNSTLKMQQLGRSLKQISLVHDKKAQQMENYKRIINDNEIVINQLNFKLKDSDNRINSLTNQLERVANILKERQNVIMELSNKCKQYAIISQEKQRQVINIKQNYEKLNISLNYAEQSKGNFQIFIKEIERLNHIVIGKEGQIKNLKTQLGKMIQKIDQIGQQQLKILKILQSTYENSSQKDIELNNQFASLKDYINRINQNTNGTLKDLYLQSSNIINQLNLSENETKQSTSKVQQKLLQANRTLAKQQSQNGLLKREIQELNTKLKQYQKNSVHQSQIFEKILQLSRENAAVREQLVQITSQREFEMQDKNKSIIHLQSQVNQLQNHQANQIKKLNLYIQQKQHSFEEKIARLSQENIIIKQQLNKNEMTIKNKENIIRQLENKLIQVQSQIEHKMNDLKMIQKQLFKHTQQIQKQKRLNQQSNGYSHQKSQIDIYQKQIAKLQKLIQLRQQQLSKNEQSFEKLQLQLKKYKHSVNSSNSYKQKYIQYSLHLQQITLQKQQIQQKLKDAQNMIYYLQQTVQNSNHSQNSQQFIMLKEQNEALQRQLKQFYVKLRQNEGKLGMAQQQVSNLMQQITKMNDMRNQIYKIQEIQNLQQEKQQLQQTIYHLSNQNQKAISELNHYRIENDHLQRNTQQNKLFLHSFQYKSGEVERQYKKLKEVYDNLNRQYSKLEMKNHEFQLELKKAEILQQKIQVLNGQLNRLSLQNIDLNQEISQCKLALSDESTIQRRNVELMTLIVLLMAQVQSLRSRNSTQEIQLNNSRILQLGRTKN